MTNFWERIIGKKPKKPEVPKEIKEASEQEIDEALQPLEEESFFAKGEYQSTKAKEDIETQEAIDEVAIKAEIERQARPRLEALIPRLEKDLSIDIPLSDVDKALEVLANAAVLDARGGNLTEYSEADARGFLTPEIIADALTESSKEVKEMKQALVEEIRRLNQSEYARTQRKAA